MDDSPGSDSQDDPFVVQKAVRRAIHAACPELFDGTIYEDFPLLVVANVMEALRSLPVAERMEAMGMILAARFGDLDEPTVIVTTDAWAIGAPLFMEAKWNN